MLLSPLAPPFGQTWKFRGPGTCDISAWDSFYLAMFWMLNTNAWTMLYFHWTELTIWQNYIYIYIYIYGSRL